MQMCNLIYTLQTVCLAINFTLSIAMYRLQVLFFCKAGFVAYMPQVDTPETVNNIESNPITNLTALAEELNVTKIFLVCIKVPEPVTKRKSCLNSCGVDKSNSFGIYCISCVIWPATTCIAACDMHGN